MKALITGGAGFIGSNLAHYLHGCNINIIVVDNLSTGRLENLQGIQDKILFIKKDILDVNVEDIRGVDVIFHLAAQASVPISISNFQESTSSNISGSINILDIASRLDIPLVYASSSAVYGNLEFGIEDGSVDLLSPYAADKYFLEIYSKILFQTRGLRSFGFRFFNVYGPRQDSSNPYAGVISIFVRQMLTCNRIKINGGQQTRDFIYIEDICRALSRACSQLMLGQAKCEISNALTGKPVSIMNLADLIGKTIKYNYEYDIFPLDTSDPLRSNGSVDRFVKLVDLNELTTLPTGLLSVVEWIKNNEI